MSAAAEHLTGTTGGVEACREAARALAPCSRCDGGVTLSGSAAAALAELFRLLAREGRVEGAVPDVAARAARRLLRDLEVARETPAPRSPGDRAPAAMGGTASSTLASR